MKKYSFLLKKNNKFSIVHACIILLISVMLQSCSEEFINASVDSNKVRYEYTINGVQRVSPDISAIGLNIGFFFASGGAGATNNNSTFFNNKNFNNSQFLYAYNSKERGPMYSGVQNSELNIPKFENNAPSNNIQQNIRFMGGLELVGKGSSSSHSYYIEAPLYATYWTDLSNGKIFGGLGPYIAYGFGKPFSSSGSFNAFDAGLTLMGRYKLLNSFSFSLGYDFGLANISKNSGAGDKANNRTISLNFGYPLNKIIKKK